MPIIGFSHYNLRAPRALLDELRDFYCEVVGLTVGHRPPFRSFGYWLYAGEHAVLHLSEAAPDENRPAQPAGTFDHAAFRCTDRAAYEGKLASRGIKYRVAVVPATQQLQIFLTDPAGNGVELNFANQESLTEE
jgi:catechol-2,3-dioxygenase